MMVSKFIIYCVILIAISTIVSTQSNKSKKKLDKLQQELKSTNQKILKAFPKNMNTEQKRAARNILDRYIRAFRLNKTRFKKKVNKRVSKQDWKELDKEFDNTVKAVEILLSSARGLIGKLNPLSVAKKSTDKYHHAVRNIVDTCKKGGEKTVKFLIGWLGQCIDISSDFLDGIENLLDDDSDDYDSDDDDDDDHDDDDADDDEEDEK